MSFDLQRFAQEKTEAPTPRRREQARQRGQVARTGELGTALVLLAGFGVAALLAGTASRSLLALTRHYLEQSAAWQPDAGAIQALFVSLVMQAGLIVGPLMLAAALVGALSQVVQVGFVVSGEPLKPRLDRLNPVQGLQRIFSRRALVDLVRSLAKVAVVGWIAYREVRTALVMLPDLLGAPFGEAAALVGQVVLRTGLWIGGALLVIAAADYLFQRSEHERQLRMSRQELKEELKQTEGDPQLRARIRQRQRQLASRRMMHAVPTADVVVTNPVHLAVALKYDAVSMSAPVVVAKGAGLLARRIKELAEEHGVPVVEDVWLARALYNGVEIGQEIPVELYRAVADVLAFVYRMRARRR
ncbi:MAG: flagellar biosynthesis protein FlhB [Firmicutes bacterium ZCTH02-B6]|nr:MAG: flagellar biosynthesis protein FlhB [Firmicutes bacterium ZCTH02-B6]